MTSKVDIYNMALGHLGITTTIASLTENTKERKACDRFYGNALLAIFRDRDWPFATRFKFPGLVEQFTDSAREWDYSYRYPTDCAYLRRIMPLAGRTSRAKIPFRIASDESGRLIYTDQQDAQIEYTAIIPDPTKFPADFTLALSYRLAAYIAPSLTRGDDAKLGKAALQSYFLELGLAAANSFNEDQRDQNQPDSEFITVREG